jgi:hypothetical protein
MAPSARSTHALLPAGLLTEDGKAPERTEVELGDVSAYRYAGLPGDLTAFVAPTDAGVATVACEPPVGDACEAVASTLMIDGAEILPLGPDKALGSAVAKVLGEYDRTGAAASRALRTADTPRGQSRVADRARSRFAAVGRALGRLEPGPADARGAAALQRAVSASASAWERLSGAARRSDRAGYNRAAGATRRARQEVAAAVSVLAAAGYTGLKTPGAVEIARLENTPVRRATTPSTQSAPQTNTTPRATPTPAPRTNTNPTPRSTPAPQKAKPTPVPAKPTPVPIGGDS